MSKIESDTNTLSKIPDNILLLTYQINNRHSNPLKHHNLTPHPTSIIKLNLYTHNDKIAT